MADCIVNFDGQEYSYPEFAQALNDGLLEELINNGDVVLGGKDRAAVKTILGSDMVQESDSADELTDALDGNPRTKYNPQKVAEAIDHVEKLTEQEKLLEVGKISSFAKSFSNKKNIGVLAGISLIEDYLAKGDVASAERIIADISELGTVAGQLIQQFSLLANSTPKGLTFTIDKMLKKQGYNGMTTEQAAKVEQLFLEEKQLSDAAKEAIKAFVENPTDGNRIKMNQAISDREDAARKMASYLSNYMPKKFFDTLGMVMQGNLLNSMSVVANPIFNAMFTPFMLAKDEIASVFDFVASQMTKQRTTKSKLNTKSVKSIVPAFFKGGKDAFKESMKGSAPEDLKKYDVQRNLKPLRALAEAWAQLTGKSGDFATRKDGKFDAERFASNYIEGTIGIPANILLRALPYGDKPFFEMLRTLSLINQAQIKGLKGSELDKFILSPDEESSQIANDYAKEGTFQDENSISKAFTAMGNFIDARIPEFGGLSSALKFLIIKVNSPFVKTPANVLNETLNYTVPAYSMLGFATNMAKWGYYIKKLNNLKADKEATAEQIKEAEADVYRSQKDMASSLGKVFIAGALTFMAQAIIKAGFVHGDDDDEKSRAFGYATGGPRTLNLSAYQRWVSSGFKDTKVLPTDEKVSLDKLGMFGASIAIQNEVVGEKLKGKKKDVYDTKGDLIEEESNKIKTTFEQMIQTGSSAVAFTFQQGFLQNTSAVAEALTSKGPQSESKYRALYKQYYKTLLTTAAPNSLDQFSRANRDYMNYTKDQSLTKEFVNIAKQKFGIFGTDKDLPIKYGLFGEKVNQTPKGSNPILYQGVNVFKKGQMFQDRMYYDLQMLLDESGGDKDLIPSVPGDEVTYKGKTIDLSKLSEKDKNEFVRVVGEARRKYVEPILDKGESYSEGLKEKLVYAYELGLEEGKNKYFKDNPIVFTK